MKLRVLGFRPDGTIAPFVSDDMYAALRAEGHPVYIVDTQHAREDFSQRGMRAWEDVIVKIRDFAPDVALFYGGSGIILFSDRHKGDGHLLADLGIPIVPCFFDDPNFVMGVQPGYKMPPSTLCFVWDRFHIEEMRRRGFNNLEHLPLGTDPTRFKPLAKPAAKFRHEIAFTGSLADPAAHMQGITEADGTLQEMFAKAVRRRLESPETSFHLILEDLARHLDSEDWQRWENFRQRPDFWTFHNALNQVTNVIWREQVVTSIALNGLPVAVYGGEAWRDKEGVDWRGGIHYQKGLPKLYASTPLHLNLTAPQLATSINNRVYDVLASGSAALTDWREELGEAFVPEDHLIVFHNVEEAVEKALAWRGREKELREMAARGRAHVLAHHTWRHRMARAMAVVGERGV